MSFQEAQNTTIGDDISNAFWPVLTNLSRSQSAVSVFSRLSSIRRTHQIGGAQEQEAHHFDHREDNKSHDGGATTPILAMMVNEQPQTRKRTSSLSSVVNAAAAAAAKTPEELEAILENVPDDSSNKSH